MNLFIFITFCAFIANATSQYYYVGQPAVYHIPPTYNAFSHPFSTYHINPQFQQFRTVPAHQYRPVPPPTPPPVPAPVHRTQYTQNDDAEYRGFAYHTRTDSGATSHVLFVTGPQAQQVNSRVFNNFNSHAFGQNNNDNHNNARTFASEMIDPVKKTESQEEKTNVLPKNIQDLYSPPAMQKVENNDPFQFFQSVFQNHENPSTRLINFYSRNTDLFAQQVPGYPANVAPLPYNVIRSRLLNTDDEKSNSLTTHDQLKNNTESESSMEKQDAEDKKSDNEVAAESVITNTRFKLNEITEQTNKDNIGKVDENQSSSLTSSPTTDSLEMSAIASSSSESTETSDLPSPSTQRPETSSERNSTIGSLSPTTSISSSSEEQSITKSNSSNLLALAGPLSGTSTTSSSTTIASNLAEDPAGFLIQRPGNQPPTLAQSSVASNEMPSSSLSEQSMSESLLLMSQKSSPQLNGTLMQGLNMRILPMSKNVQTPQDLISGNTSHFPVSTFNVTETVSTSGLRSNKMEGASRSTETITSFSPSAISPSSGNAITSSLNDSTTIYLASASSESVSSTTMSSIISTSIHSSSSESGQIITSSPSDSESSSGLNKFSITDTDQTTTLSEIKDTTATATTTEYFTTADSTTGQVQLTTNYNDEDVQVFDVITTKTFESNSDLARLTESSLAETTEGGVEQMSEVTSTAGNSNEENITTENILITTENILITTDAMLTTTSQ